MTVPHVVRRATPRGPRVNQQIRMSPVRVIANDGTQLGIVDVSVALGMAEEQGLDLVEVAPTARPPVCRIMDHGRWRFEQAKQARLAKKNQHVIQVKEAKYRPGIDRHDFDTKTRHVREWLTDGHKVKVTLQFRGRQITHPELGQQVLDRVVSAVADVGRIETAAKLEGKLLSLTLAPAKR